MNAASGPIYSSYASDPDFQELIEEFVERVADRVRTMQEMIERHDTDSLTRAIHQLRGACGSYGFHEMTSPATAIELSLQAGVSIAEMREELGSFLVACTSMTATMPQATPAAMTANPLVTE